MFCFWAFLAGGVSGVILMLVVFTFAMIPEDKNGRDR